MQIRVTYLIEQESLSKFAIKEKLVLSADRKKLLSIQDKREIFLLTTWNKQRSVLSHSIR